MNQSRELTPKKPTSLLELLLSLLIHFAAIKPAAKPRHTTPRQEGRRTLNSQSRTPPKSHHEIDRCCCLSLSRAEGGAHYKVPTPERKGKERGQRKQDEGDSLFFIRPLTHYPLIPPLGVSFVSLERKQEVSTPEGWILEKERKKERTNVGAPHIVARW